MNETINFDNGSAAHMEFVKKYSGHPLNSMKIPTAWVLTICAFGFFGNANILWATFRKKRLRTQCNILIACVAACDIVHQCAHVVLGYYLYTDINFVTVRQCYFAQLGPSFGINVGGFLILVIGVDRLFGVLAPARYNVWNKGLYLFLMILSAVVFGSAVNFFAYLQMIKDPNYLVICTASEFYHGAAREAWGATMMLVNLAVIAVYSILWASLRIRRAQKCSHVDQRIIKSVSVIMLMVLGGWFTMAALMKSDFLGNMTELGKIVTIMWAGTGINSSVAANYPVYMYFSREYRQAFLEQLRILSCNRSFKSSIVSMNMTPLSWENRSAGRKSITIELSKPATITAA